MNIYTEIFNSYYNIILKYCNSKLKNIYDAEDCTQEVFFAFSRKQRQLNFTVNIENWLYRAADIEMKAYRRKNIQSEELNEDLLNDSFDISKDNPIKSLLDTEDYNLLTDFYILGKSVEEISIKLGVSISAVYKKIYRVKMELINLLNSNKINL